MCCLCGMHLQARVLLQVQRSKWLRLLHIGKVSQTQQIRRMDTGTSSTSSPGYLVQHLLACRQICPSSNRLVLSCIHSLHYHHTIAVVFLGHSPGCLCSHLYHTCSTNPLANHERVYMAQLKLVPGMQCTFQLDAVWQRSCLTSTALPRPPQQPASAASRPPGPVFAGHQRHCPGSGWPATQGVRLIHAGSCPDAVPSTALRLCCAALHLSFHHA